MNHPTDTLEMPRLHVGDGWHCDGLTLFPVWVQAPSIHGLSLGAGTVEVSEREGAPIVGELTVRNTGTKPALLLEGEMLEGGWQHRVLDADLLLAPGAATAARVSCVERGRWQGGTAHVRSSRMSSGSVRVALRQPDDRRQGQVWQSVARFDQHLGASPTSSLADHLDRLESRARDAGFGDIPQRPVSGQRGVIVALGGHPAWLEVMPSSGALANRWRSLVEAALLDAALAPRVRTAGQAARDFAAAAAHLPLQVTGSGGSGRAVTGVRRALNARGLITADGVLVHSLVMNTAHHAFA